MELNFKFNPFDYVAIEKTSSKMRGTCLEFREVSVFEISSKRGNVRHEYWNNAGQQQGCWRIFQSYHGDLFVPGPCFQPDEGIAAVIVLVGAFNVYFKMQNGDQDVKKTIMLTIGGCVAFIAMSEALSFFFK